MPCEGCNCTPSSPSPTSVPPYGGLTVESLGPECAESPDGLHRPVGQDSERSCYHCGSYDA